MDVEATPALAAAVRGGLEAAPSGLGVAAGALAVAPVGALAEDAGALAKDVVATRDAGALAVEAPQRCCSPSKSTVVYCSSSSKRVRPSCSSSGKVISYFFYQYSSRR
jgi:hypothetical protein